MSPRIYCTYFDHRYLPKGLAMIRSLRRQVPDAQVWVLCLSPQAQTVLQEMEEPGVHAVSLPDLEADDTELAKAKADGRTTIEYYFTLTPALILHVMRAAPEAETVTYLDGDLWFLADPEAVYREMDGNSVLIIPHGFTPEMKHREQYGLYNVGWVSFRADARGRACLEWWRERTIEWCFDRVEDGRFADQGYLDQFPGLFEGVHVLANRGANLAPWNVAASTISARDGVLRANEDPVIFFHFHDLKKLPSGEYLASHGAYKAPLTPLMRDSLYRPYLRELSAVEQEIPMHVNSVVHNPIREPGREKPAARYWWRGWRSKFGNALAAVMNRRRGYIVSSD